MSKYTTTTNSDGVAEFEVEYDTYRVTIVKDGFKTVTLDVPFSEDSREFRVTFEHIQGTELTIEVQDDGGIGIPGAFVRLVGDVTVEDITDSSGKVYFEVPYGNYTATIAKDGYITATEDITFTEEHKTFTITLEPVTKHQLTILVSDEYVQPAEGALVTINDNATNEEHSATTDSEGKVIFEVYYGDYTVTTTKDGYKTATSSITFSENQKTFHVTLEPAPETDTLRITVSDTEEAGNSLVEGATVKISKGSDEYTATTGVDGVVEFQQLEYGDYTATISKEGYYTTTEAIQFRSNHKNFNITIIAVQENVMTLVWDSSKSATINTYTESGNGIIISNDATATINWGDGTTSTFEQPTDFEHTYTETGTYNVTMTIENGTVERFGYNCFHRDVGEEQYALKRISFPAGLSAIEDGAFQDCKGLEAVNFYPGDDSITELGRFCFSQCTSLIEITLPNSLESINESLFEESGLKSISIPASVTVVGLFAFHGCFDLERVVFNGTNVTEIKNGCFMSCLNLTEINLPEGLLKIKESAFHTCTGLVTINLPSTVTSLGDGCFTDCHFLESLTVPASVVSAGKDIIEDCRNLTVLNLDWVGEAILWFSASFEDNLNWNNITINIPAGSFDDYVNKGYHAMTLQDNRLRS